MIGIPGGEAGPETEIAAARAGRRALRLRPLVIGTLVGSAVALVAWLVVFTVLFRDPIPDVTQTALDEAVARWQENGPTNYELDLSLSGSQTAEIHLEVHDGEVTDITYNGRPPRQRRVGTFWTIPAQFDIIERELHGVDDPEKAFGAPAGSTVVVKAEFDPKYGYPQRYRRNVLGSSMAIEWNIKSFQPLP